MWVPEIAPGRRKPLPLRMPSGRGCPIGDATMTILFEVWHDDIVVGAFEKPTDALERAKALVAEGATWVTVIDPIGRRYTPLEFERMFLPKAPPELR